MNPTLQAALASILRHFFTLAAGTLVAKGIWTQADATIYIDALVLFVLGLGWSLYKNYITKLIYEEAVEAPPGTPHAEIKANAKAQATTMGFLTGSRKSVGENRIH